MICQPPRSCAYGPRSFSSRRWSRPLNYPTYV